VKNTVKILSLIFSITLAVLLILNSDFALAQPANDACTTPQVITIPNSGNICVTSTTVGATSDNATNTCDTGTPGNEVWFTYTATGAANTVTVTPTGSPAMQRAVVTITSTNCVSGTYNSCNASSTNAGAATTNWTFTPGTQIWISVESDNGVEGSFQLCITSIDQPPAPGNSCATASVLCDQSTFSVTPFPANTSGLTPPCFGSALQRPVYFQFTVGQTGILAWNADVIGTAEYDWALYNITAGCYGTNLACNYNYTGTIFSPGNSDNIGMQTGLGSCTGEFCPAMTVNAGNTYLIIIDNYSNNTVGFSMSFTGSTFQMAPTSQFTVSPSTGCAPLTVTLNNTSIASTSSSWNFGNGTTSVAASPPAQTYSTPGTYLISLTSTSSTGCTDVSSQSVVVTNGPVATVPADITQCAGSTVAAATFTSTPTGATFAWTNSNTAIGLGASGNGNTPSFTATNSTGSPITATITVTPTLNGCSGVPSTYDITINPGPAVSVNSPTICPGGTANLVATGATTYTWSGGATVTGVGTANASPASTTTYTVTGTTAGCTGTATATVTVAASLTVTVNSPTICAGAQATLTAGGANTYVWSDGSTDNPLIVSPASTTTYTVTGTSGGCSGTATSTVTVNPQPSLSVNSPTICSGGSATLTATGATSYLWDTGSTSNPLNVSPGTSTTYTVTGTTGNCSATATSTVTVSSSLNVTVNSPTVCSGQNATLTAAGATTYVWSDGSTDNPLIITPASTANYTVTGTSLSCTGTATATITVNPVPVVNVNSPAVCAGTTATLTATGATTYLWNNGATDNPLTVSPSVTTTYIVTGTDQGCSANATSTVTVNPAPSVAVNSPTICVGDAATLTATGASTYLWSTGETTDQISVSPVSSTTYMVTGTDLGCSATVTSTVTVNQTTITLLPTAAAICEGDVVTLTASGATSYAWSPPTGLSSSSGNSVSASPIATTTYTITGTDNGCTDDEILTVTVNPNPVVDFEALPASGCVPLAVQFNDLSSVASGTNVNWLWAADNASFSDQQNNSYTFTAPGSYDITLTVTTDQNCTATLTYPALITASPNPVADFAATPEWTQIISPEVTFTDLSSGNPVQWNWDFGTGDGSALQNPVYSFPDTGTYTVILSITNQYGCIDLTEMNIVIAPFFTLYVPSAFTPDGNGLNDIFLPLGETLRKYELRIFNRWGEQIFESFEPSVGWNGKSRNTGKDLSPGVYVYRISVEDEHNRPQDFKGIVTLVR
jgi:gliding motility-associated-like protein